MKENKEIAPPPRDPRDMLTKITKLQIQSQKGKDNKEKEKRRRKREGEEGKGKDKKEKGKRRRKREGEEGKGKEKKEKGKRRRKREIEEGKRSRRKKEKPRGMGSSGPEVVRFFFLYQHPSEVRFCTAPPFTRGGGGERATKYFLCCSSEGT